MKNEGAANQIMQETGMTGLKDKKPLREWSQERVKEIEALGGRVISGAELFQLMCEDHGITPPAPDATHPE